ncbi:hypothetical protein [Pendulispora albinea]|uniref:Uncharacterized protein n=1 Tax=Pendulispora albinea TaxID=2741071 RepID=A0ABZ2LXS6_9BACT
MSQSQLPHDVAREGVCAFAIGAPLSAKVSALRPLICEGQRFAQTHAFGEHGLDMRRDGITPIRQSPGDASRRLRPSPPVMLHVASDNRDRAMLHAIFGHRDRAMLHAIFGHRRR